jgi:hypothetical protein
LVKLGLPLPVAYIPNAAPLKKKPLEGGSLVEWNNCDKRLQLTHPAGGIHKTDPSNLAISDQFPDDPSEYESAYSSNVASIRNFTGSVVLESGK